MREYSGEEGYIRIFVLCRHEGKNANFNKPNKELLDGRMEDRLCLWSGEK